MTDPSYHFRAAAPPVGHYPQAGPAYRAARIRRRRLLLLLVIGGVLTASAVIAAVLVMPSGSTTKQIAVAGSVTVTNRSGIGVVRTFGGGCQGGVATADITEGAQVVLTDDTGKMLTTTALGPGRTEQASCVFTFTAQVPAGRASYGVSVGQRPAVMFSESDVAHASVRLAG